MILDDNHATHGHRMMTTLGMNKRQLLPGVLEGSMKARGARLGRRVRMLHLLRDMALLGCTSIEESLSIGCVALGTTLR